jgi:hypothetical protein
MVDLTVGSAVERMEVDVQRVDPKWHVDRERNAQLVRLQGATEFRGERCPCVVVYWTGEDDIPTTGYVTIYPTD